MIRDEVGVLSRVRILSPDLLFNSMET